MGAVSEGLYDILLASQRGHWSKVGWHRVYYDAAERPEEVWAQHSDGSCRWRQTGSELKVIALKVAAAVSFFAITWTPHLLICPRHPNVVPETRSVMT